MQRCSLIASTAAAGVVVVVAVVAVVVDTSLISLSLYILLFLYGPPDEKIKCLLAHVRTTLFVIL